MYLHNLGKKNIVQSWNYTMTTPKKTIKQIPIVN